MTASLLISLGYPPRPTHKGSHVSEWLGRCDRLFGLELLNLFPLSLWLFALLASHFRPHLELLRHLYWRLPGFTLKELFPPLSDDIGQTDLEYVAF